jgi:hypothetical protein
VCIWRGLERGRRLPSRRSKRWPAPTIADDLTGRKRRLPACFVLSTVPTRCSTPSSVLRGAQAAFGLGSHHPGSLPAASRRGERTLVPARCRKIPRAPFPRSVGFSPFLFSSLHQETAAILETLASRGGGRAGRGSGDFDRRLDAAFGMHPTGGLLVPASDLYST